MPKKEYDDTNRGTLFVNDDKQSENSPDYSGPINVDGKEYRLSGWKDQTAKGPVLRLSIQPKEAKGGGFQRSKAPAAKPARGNSRPADNDDEPAF